MTHAQLVNDLLKKNDLVSQDDMAKLDYTIKKKILIIISYKSKVIIYANMMVQLSTI